MSQNDKGPTLNGNKKKSNGVLIFLLVILLLGAIGLGLYTVMTQQFSTRSRADEGATDTVEVVETVDPTQAPEITEPPAEPATDPAAEPTAEPATEPSVEPTAEPEAETPALDETISPTETPIVAAGGGEEVEPTVAPTQALVSSLSCPVNGASCAWDAVTGATSYNVSVVDKTTNNVVTQQTISGTSVSFTAIIEHNYECSVSAQNECGTSGTASGANTCRSNVTPTVTPQVTATPGPSATPTPGPSATPTPPSGTVIVQSGPAPTIPSAGSSSTVYFMIISTILVATLFLVF